MPTLPPVVKQPIYDFLVGDEVPMGGGEAAIPIDVIVEGDPRLTDARTPTGAAGGSLSGSYPNPTIAGNQVTNAALSDMAQATIKGRASGAGLGDPTDLTANQVSTILDAATDPFVRTSAVPGGGDMLGANNLTDVASAASSFDNIKQAATDSYTGVVELATNGENAPSVVVQGNDSRLSDSRPPNGSAGGVLSGSYPNPGFAVDMATQAELDAHTSDTSNPHSVTAAQIGAGDVTGPATNTDNFVPQWNGANSKTLKNGLETSDGSAGAADAGKLAIFNSNGQLKSNVGFLALNGSDIAHYNGAGQSFTDFSAARTLNVNWPVLTAHRMILWPDKDGTIAMTSDIPSVANFNTFNHPPVVSTTTDSTAVAIPLDTTLPQNTEGKEYLTFTMTPKDASSVLEIEFTAMVGGSTNMAVMVALFKDSDASAIETIAIPVANNAQVWPVTLRHRVAAAGAGSRTYKIRFGGNTGTAHMLRSASVDYFSGGKQAVFTVKEILP